MTSVLKTFLFQIIDYAGLYPPANLSLDEAIRNFIKYQKEDESWMLSRFIIPAKRLTELADMLPREQTLSFSALGRGGKDADEFLENIKLDIVDILAFREIHGASVIADVFETTLPASTLTELPATLELLNKTSDLLNKNGLTVFFEAPFGTGWEIRAENLIRALHKLKDKHVGFKLRTGGVTADAFPTSAQIAWALAKTRDADIPIKATAGLHHPIRHYNESVSTKMHGFLNVFSAGMLAITNNISAEQIESILEDEDPKSFMFNEKSFTWKNIPVNIEQIEQARQQITSFGSCSFDEPREDLQKLRLLNTHPKSAPLVE